VQVLGDGVGALAPKHFFAVPSPQNAKFEGTVGDSLSLGNKCWLSIIMYHGNMTVINTYILPYILPFNA